MSTFGNVVVLGVLICASFVFAPMLTIIVTLACLLPLVLWALWVARWYVIQIAIATFVYGYSVNDHWFANDAGGRMASIWLALFSALMFTLAVNKAVDLWRRFVLRQPKIQAAVPLANPAVRAPKVILRYFPPW
jgi:hypothetical protein